MMRGMLCAPFVCFKCRNRFTDRLADAQQDDVCARCLHDLRVAARVEEPREPPACDPDFVAIRDRIEHGPIPPWGFNGDDFERLRAAKYEAKRLLEEAPSDASFARYRAAERGLLRLQNDNRIRREEFEGQRRGASA